MAPSDQLPDVSLADAEAQMQKGRGGMLVVMGGLAVAIIAGLVLLVGGDDERRVYGELGKKINSIRQAQFDQFWGCALPGANVADIRTNADLVGQLEGRGSERGQAYAEHLRTKCKQLEDIGPQLDSLIIPPDLQSGVEAMRKAVGQLRGGVSAYTSYLDDPELEYDHEAAKPHLTEIARGWYEFRKAHGALNDTIRKKVE